MKARFQFLFILVLLSLLAGCSPTASPANSPPPTEFPPLPTTAPPQFVSAITGSSKPLLFPTTVAVDAQGNLYVADVGHAQVQVFGPNGNFLTAWGAPGRGDGQFFVSDHCCFLGVDGESNVYVMDSSSRIQKFDSKGNFLDQWGSPGTGDGQFSDWATIAVSQDGTVYVGDENQGGIQKFDHNGEFLLRWGGENTGSPALFYPITVVLDEAGNVYARDGTEGKILKFDPNGDLLSEFSLPEIDGKVPLAGGFVVDSHGNVYVSDLFNNRLVALDSHGSVLSVWGSSDSGDRQVLYPKGMALDANGNLYVASYSNHRVLKYRLP